MHGPNTNIIGRGRPKNVNPLKTKRYNLVLPDDLYAEVKCIADTEQTSVIEAFKKIIKYGLLLFKIMKDPDSRLVIRQGETEREIVIA
jgi:hypothetical protein